MSTLKLVKALRQSQAKNPSNQSGKLEKKIVQILCGINSWDRGRFSHLSTDCNRSSLAYEVAPRHRPALGEGRQNPTHEDRPKSDVFGSGTQPLADVTLH